ncbi:MAG: TonB-dependent receptor, partial [Bacteroidetes bacterium]|nr:TonB-dependent receptor [Bacteroidota bacterium]
RYNTSGEIYNANGEIVGFYNNETDNYNQKNYQLLWEQKLGNLWKLNTTIHYTQGKGYYDNYKSNQKYSKYGLPNIIIGNTTISRADLIRQKWLDNNFYGIVSELQGKLNQWNINIGWVANQYFGKHFGEITDGTNLQPSNLPWEYYRNHALKNEISAYGKVLYSIDNWGVFADAQFRNIQYDSRVDKASAEESPEFDKKYFFFNPKIGTTYQAGFGNFYFSYANAHREPARNDLKENPNIQPEQLHDFELGYNTTLGNISIAANVYYMLYENQLVLTGAVNDVGAALHENSGKSYRRGLEIVANYKLSKQWNILANTTISQNKNQNYIVETNFGTTNFGNTNIAFSPDFIGNATINYLPTEKISLSLVQKFVGKQYINNTQTEEYKLNAYQLTDFLANYKCSWGKTDIGIFVLVNNIFNRSYTNYGVDYGSPYYYAQAKANFLLGVNLKFN